MPHDDMRTHESPGGGARPQSVLPDARRKNALIWYFVGLAILGLTIGYFAGLSESPVAATLLPLLFGLIGAGSGLYLAQTDLSSPDSSPKLKLLGAAAVTLSAACVAGSAYGVSLRSGVGLLDFVPSVRRGGPASINSISTVPASESVKLITLRTRLQLVGATDSEIQTILNRIGGAEKEQPKRELDTALIAAAIGQLDKASASVGKMLSMREKLGADAAPAEWWEELSGLWAELLRAQPILNNWQTGVRTGWKQPYGFVPDVAERLDKSIQSVTSSPDILMKVSKLCGVEAETLPQLRGSLEVLKHNSNTEILSDSEALSDVDQVLELMYGKREAESEPPRLTRPRPSIKR